MIRSLYVDAQLVRVLRDVNAKCLSISDQNSQDKVSPTFTEIIQLPTSIHNCV
jgi:hypothetical protein